MSVNSFNSRSTLKVGSKEYEIYRLDALDKQGISTKHLPFSLRILLENLLRTEDGRNVTKEEMRALAAWNSKSKPEKEIAFTPSRVLLQDFTGVPCVVDLAAMRDAMKQLGGDPTLINPLQPAELVIDHSVQVDEFGTANALRHERRCSNSSATKNAMPSCAGDKQLFTIWPSSLPTPESFTRSISNISPAWFSSTNPRQAHRLSRHPGRHRFAHHDD